MKSIIFLYSLLFCLSAHAQTNKTDSLLVLIKSAKTDTGRINLMNNLASRLTQNDLDSAIRYSKKVIAEAQRVHYVAGEVSAHQNMAEGLIRKGNFETAKEEIQKAETLARTLKDSTSVALVYAVYGMMYGMQSKYDSSILYYKKNISLLENTADSSKLSRSYQNIAISYQMQSNLRQTIYYQTRALRIAETNRDTNRLAYISVNMGISYELLNDTSRAEESYLKGIAYAKAAEVKNVELYGYSNLSTFFEKSNYKKAYEYAIKAVTLGEQIGDSAIMAANLGRAGLALANQGNFAEAERLDEKAIIIAQLAGQPIPKFQTFVAGGAIKKLQKKYPEAIDLYEKGFAFLQESDQYSSQTAEDYYDLSYCYEKTGRIPQALAAYKKATEIKDSASSRENVRKSTELSMQYDFDKEQQAAKAKQEKLDAIAASKQMALIIGLALTLVVIILIVYAYRNKQKANTLLTHQKEEIAEQKDKVETTLQELKATQAQLIQSEKMASLGELTAGIAHEIQNPLNFVNNFSDINSEMIEDLKAELADNNFEEVLSIANNIQSNEQKIVHHGKRADAIVKGMLQHSKKNTGQKEPTDINALCDEYLRLAYHGLRAKDKSFTVNFTTGFDETINKINIIPQDFGRVLLNIFNNAFYATSEKQKSESEKQNTNYKPSVSVQTKKVNSKTEIRIEDNGNGIPSNIMDKIFQPFFTTKPTGQGTGLGLSLAYDIITKEHNGSIQIESKEGKGSTFIIQL